MTFKISTRNKKSCLGDFFFEEILLHHRILSIKHWIKISCLFMEYKTSTTTMYLSFTDMTTFFANDLVIHKNKTDQYQMS